MEVNPPAPTTSAPGAAWRSVKIQVTASRMFTVDILPEESVQDVERLILSKVARQGLQLTAIKVVEADSEEGSVSVGDDLLPSAVKGIPSARLHLSV